jgi:outer membrane protein
MRMKMVRSVLTSLGLVCSSLWVGLSSAAAQELGAAQSTPAGQVGQPSSTATAAFPSDARIAIVDVDRVASLSSEGKAATAKLEELRNKKQAEVSARGKEVEALQAKLAQTSSLVDDAERVRQQRELERARLNLQRFTADAQAEVQEAQQETIRWFNTRLFPVINAIATEKKLWAIFQAENALWFDPAIDLTEEVARRLDAASTPKR